MRLHIRVQMTALAGLLLALSSTARAQVDVDPLVSLNVHFTPWDYTGCPAVDDEDFALCEDLESTVANSQTLRAWLFVAKDGGLEFDDVKGIKIVNFGIEYPGTVSIGGWWLCTGGEEFPQRDGRGVWPRSSSGNAVTWAGGCYVPTGEVAKIGYFKIHRWSQGVFAMTGDPRLYGTARVHACAPSQAFDICDAALGFGITGVGSRPTCVNVCRATPTEEATWSRLKTLF